MTSKEKVLKKLKDRYSQERILRDEAVDQTKRMRLELAKYTFSDLDSGGRNTFVNMLKKREKWWVRKFRTKEAVLNRLDKKIDEIMRT